MERFCQRYAVLLDAQSTLPVPGNPFGAALDVGQQCGLTTLGPQRDQVLRLEDVKKQTRATFGQLMARMGVAMDDCLLQSTFTGLEYDAPASTPVKGFETSNLERKPGALFSEHDQRVMNLLLYPIAVQYGYRAADPAHLEREIAWYKPIVAQPLDFEKKSSPNWLPWATRRTPAARAATSRASPPAA